MCTDMTAMRQSSGEEGRRDYLRLDLGLLAHIETLEGRKKVEIIDLSQGGARVKLLAPVENIKDCVLVWLGFDTYATIGRRDGDELGLVFDVPLRPVVIKKTREMAPRVWRNDSVYLCAIARDFVQGGNRT